MAEALSTLQLALLAQQADEQRRLLAAEPIAIVGVGCRFPAGADRPDLCTPESFWRFLEGGGCAVQEVPADRWAWQRYSNPASAAGGTIRSRQGSFLKQVDQFDPGCFGISPREARAIDPQHRLLLEVAQEALERAGYGAGQLAGSSTGVFMGLCTTDYAWRQLRGGVTDDSFDLYFATGNSFSVAAGRLAHVLGLQGPALAVDTACSSSLVAVDLACRSLRDRSCDLALAGGVNVLLSPVTSLCFSRSGMLAADGLCKSFDASADGYARGEGCGVLVLRRLADALAAGDPIAAVLRGSAVNQDGASAGLTVPNGAAQAGLLRRTLAQAGLTAEQVDVLEAHGTGTPLGDPIELKAAAQVYGRPERATPLLLGSVKTNLGHLEGAAGIAGLIKAVLMVQRGRIPPHLHLRQPTPQFPWAEWALSLSGELRDWPQSGRPRRVAVSSFGFSGTNAHVLVEQAPEEAQLSWPRAEGPQWLLLAARSEVGLVGLVECYLQWLPQQPPASWPAICGAARRALRPWPWRLAVRADDVFEAAEALARATAVACTPTASRLAVRLDAASTPAQWQAWRAHGIHPSAVVYAPEQEILARQLAGTPATLRLVPLDGAASILAAHGYGDPVLLAEPSPARLVELWLAGHRIQWQLLEPAVPWPRPVLPVSGFERQRCWFEDDMTPAAPIALGLEHHPHWRLLEPSAAGLPSTVGRWLQIESVDDPEAMAALERALAEPGDPIQVICRAPLAEPEDSRLDPSFWRRWLPLLQRLAQVEGRVHWLLGRRGSPIGEALAALARGWAREVGDRAGGLLWAGEAGEHLDMLLAAGPRAGVEWRWQDGRIEQLHWHPADPDSVAVAEATPFRIDSAATVVLSGGLGALGLATARWLVQRGCCHLTLLARRAPDSEQQLALGELQRQGVTLQLTQLDVADAAGVEQLFAQLERPLAGVVHAAGVLDDGLLNQQTAERCAAVAAAKVAGGVALERASRAHPGAFFLVYSSLAAVLGSPGQLAYGAANGYLDGLVQQRRRLGLPGLAVNWGPWAGGGMASRSPQLLPLIEPEVALGALAAVLERGAQAPASVVLAQLQPRENEHPSMPALRDLAQRLPGLEEPQALAELQRCLAELIAALAGTDGAELTAATRLDALGLDSLMAVELATVVQAGLGVSLGLGALAGDPTLGSLAAHLLQLQRDPQGAELQELDLGREASLPEDLAHQLAAARAAGPSGSAPTGPGSLRQVLLTGASGFLGAFLLADQLQRHPELQIHCLVRAVDAETGTARLRRNLEHYGLWQADWQPRMLAVPGDLSQPALGLEPDRWRQLVLRLDGVLHNGAQLSYVAPYGQLRAANVGGTLEVLRLVAQRALPLEFISSTSVYEASAYRDQPLDETSDLQEWRGIHLGYSQTKWVSERLVWHAAQAGLPVRIYRPPLIAGHSRTGAWHHDDFLHRMIRGCLALGQAPELELALDLVPVDYVVAAIGALAWRPLPPGETAQVLHLHHPEPVLWSDLLSALVSRGAPLRPLPLADWLSALAAQPDNPLYPLQPFFMHRWGPEKLSYAELNQRGRRARPACARTLAMLAPHGVSCPPFEALMGPYARIFLANG